MRFDVCAHTYDEHAGPQRFFAERVAQFICSGTGFQPVRCEVETLAASELSTTSFPPLGRRDACPTKILELGAGTGALTRWLVGAGDSDLGRPFLRGLKHAKSEFGAPILATDASPAMVQFGAIAVPQASWSTLDAFNDSVPMSPLQLSSGLLHWADDPAATLARWRASLAAGGRMVHAMPCEPCLAEWRALMPESPAPWRSEAEWLEIFQGAGLRVTRSQSWTHVAVCASALEMVRGFHRTGVTGRVRVGPARLRQALRDYDAQQRVPGGVKATWAWLAVEAC